MPRIYRLAPVLLSLLFSVTTQAQTYFYVDDISVYPGTPTDQQVVEVQLSGNLSNTGSYVTSVTADVTGFDVSITVEAGSNGGLAVLVPHLESVFTGPLPAGTYTITIGGTGVLDSAPGSQHAFTVTGSAATACDSLILASVQGSPFSDSLLTVHVFNSTSTLFDYPGFILLDGDGDTLAQEVVNYFGIGQETWHSLAVSPELCCQPELSMAPWSCGPVFMRTSPAAGSCQLPFARMSFAVRSCRSSKITGAAFR
jgi:hypothetical protein